MFPACSFGLRHVSTRVVLAGHRRGRIVASSHQPRTRSAALSAAAGPGRHASRTAPAVRRPQCAVQDALSAVPPHHDFGAAGPTEAPATTRLVSASECTTRSCSPTGPQKFLRDAPCTTHYINILNLPGHNRVCWSSCSPRSVDRGCTEDSQAHRNPGQRRDSRVHPDAAVDGEGTALPVGKHGLTLGQPPYLTQGSEGSDRLCAVSR